MLLSLCEALTGIKITGLITTGEGRHLVAFHTKGCGPLSLYRIQFTSKLLRLQQLLTLLLRVLEAFFVEKKRNSRHVNKAPRIKAYTNTSSKSFFPERIQKK